MAADRDEAALAADLRDGKVTEEFIAAEFGRQKLALVLARLEEPAEAAK
jgi:hypothetical protein